VLAAAGFQTAGVVSNTVLTDEAMGLASRFESYDDFVDEKEPARKIWERNAKRTSDAAIAWLDRQRDPGRSSFLWVHYIDPHGQYQAPDDRTTDFEHDTPIPFHPRRTLRQQLIPGVDDAGEYIDRYDEEIAYCDREIGRLLDYYDSLGLAENALIIFTADHGETMNEHEVWFTHQYHVYDAITRVPLAIRFPAGPKERVSHPVSLVDLAPTMLDALGLTMPEAPDGESLFSSQSPRDVFVEASDFRGVIQRRALIRDDSKFIINVATKNGSMGKRYRYDLARDPGESKRLVWEPKRHDAEAAVLIELIAADPDPGGVPRKYAAGRQLEHPKVRPDIDPRLLEKLRGLGYVE